LQNYFSRLYIPRITWTDIIEIIIIAVVLYNILLWIMNTKAWALLKGIIVVGLFAVVAYLLNLKTILWIAGKTISVGIIALVIIFQPELRRALEQLGRKKFVLNFLNFGDNSNKDERFSVKTADEIVDACYRMGAVRTGALIVIEQDMLLEEYIKTGIPVDGIVTSQLLINIFEHNTPLHDGAVIVRGNRVVAATCYLPLTDNVNRAVADVRAAFSKAHCKLGASGSVSYMYDNLCIVRFKGLTEDETLEALLNALVDAEIENDNGTITLYGNPQDLFKIKNLSIEEFFNSF